jgi:signal transduction histidine kinase
MHLSDFIADNLEPILDEWEKYAREIPNARGMASKELRDHARQMLETIVKDLNTPQGAQEQEEKSKGRGKGGNPSAHGESGAEKHASERAKAGFTIEDLISEYRALRASVLRLWGRSSNTVQQSDLVEMTRFNEAVDQAVAESVARYSSLVRQAQDIFLGMLGHDLRNPLGAITMSAQYLMQGPSLESRYVKAAVMIYTSSKQMGQLIGDLLDFTRTRLGQGMPVEYEHADIGAIAREAVAQARAFHPENVIALEVTADASGQWDVARIGQVFSNLIGNAVKHGDRNTPIRVALSSDADNVTATVHNSGNPIPGDDIPHIFEPLCRSPASPANGRQSSGLGLGLYITREIVHAHGGTVSVASSLKDGTTFTVRLPRRRPPPG